MEALIDAGRETGIHPFYLFALVLVDLAFLSLRAEASRRWRSAMTVFFLANLGTLMLIGFFQYQYASMENFGCIIQPRGFTFWSLGEDFSLLGVLIATIFKALRAKATV